MGGFGGKVAIVTGGGSGLGEAIGKSLAARGVKVVLSDIELDSAERVAAEIEKAGATASTFLQNTAKPADCEAVEVGRRPDRGGEPHVRPGVLPQADRPERVGCT